MKRNSSLRGRLGYTVVEVMMALGVLAVGSTGIVAMQKVTIVANTRARDLATASSIAATWVDRLKTDALSWRIKTGGGTTLTKTRMLDLVGEDFPNKAGNEGTWVSPDKIAKIADLKYAALADMRGEDLFKVPPATQASEGAFCTHLRLTQILPTMIRAEVRVFWLKNHGSNVSTKYAGTLGGVPFCTEANLDAVSAATSRYHFVYVTAGLIRNGTTL
ncbi:MAG: hypothetical protein EXR75_03785 [Myxococcales bacterium]|nr:hypothetical protein [Myxococcales bacterium]